MKLCSKLKKTFIKNQKFLYKQYKKKKRADKRLRKNLENVDNSQNTVELKEDIKDENEEDFYSNPTVQSNTSLNPSNFKETRSTRKSSNDFSKESKVICPNCGILVKRVNLQHHINIVHLKIKNYICDICNLQFYLKPRLKRHLLVTF